MVSERLSIAGWRGFASHAARLVPTIVGNRWILGYGDEMTPGSTRNQSRRSSVVARDARTRGTRASYAPHDHLALIEAVLVGAAFPHNWGVDIVPLLGCREGLRRLTPYTLAACALAQSGQSRLARHASRHPHYPPVRLKADLSCHHGSAGILAEMGAPRARSARDASSRTRASTEPRSGSANRSPPSARRIRARGRRRR